MARRDAQRQVPDREIINLEAAPGFFIIIFFFRPTFPFLFIPDSSTLVRARWFFEKKQSRDYKEHKGRPAAAGPRAHSIGPFSWLASLVSPALLRPGEAPGQGARRAPGGACAQPRGNSSLGGARFAAFENSAVASQSTLKSDARVPSRRRSTVVRPLARSPPVRICRAATRRVSQSKARLASVTISDFENQNQRNFYLKTSQFKQHLLSSTG